MSVPRRLLDPDEAWRILSACDWGTLSCVLPDGTPYATPVNAVLDPSDHCLYFHCRRKGTRATALEANPAVCYVCAHDVSLPENRFITWYESAQVFGRAELLRDPDVIRERLSFICDRLLPGQTERRDAVIDRYLPAVQICRITPERVSAKRNHDD